MVETAEGGNAVTNVAKKATEETTGFISNLFGSVFKAPMGIVKGIFSNTFGNILGTLMTSGIVAGLAKFAPNFIDWIPLKIGGKRFSEVLVGEHGDADLLKNSALAGLVINGAIGAGKGVTGAVMESTDSATTGGKIGAFAGTAAIITTLGVVAYQSMKDKGIGYDGIADHSGNKSPAATPAAVDQQADKKAIS